MRLKDVKELEAQLVRQQQAEHLVGQLLALALVLASVAVAAHVQ